MPLYRNVPSSAISHSEGNFDTIPYRPLSVSDDSSDMQSEDETVNPLIGASRRGGTIGLKAQKSQRLKKVRVYDQHYRHR